MSKKVDYEKMKIEYITGDISYKKLAAKYGIAASTLTKKARRERWYAQKLQHNRSVVAKAVRIAENEQAKLFARELVTLGKLEDILDKAVSDVEQFTKYTVQKKSLDKDAEIVGKINTKALKEAAETLDLVEKMKRSMNGILSIDQQKSLELQAQRLELEKRRVDQGETDNEVKVVFESKELDNEGWAD